METAFDGESFDWRICSNLRLGRVLKIRLKISARRDPLWFTLVGRLRDNIAKYLAYKIENTQAGAPNLWIIRTRITAWHAKPKPRIVDLTVPFLRRRAWLGLWTRWVLETELDFKK